MKTTFSLLLFALTLNLALTSCDEKNSTSNAPSSGVSTKAPFVKKYTNKDFYNTKGKFLVDVAKKAYLEMFAHYDFPLTPFIEKNLWISDYGLGDFENCGLGGILIVNDKDHGYYAHDIYLLPGQMIPEHAHLPTDKPAKFESWMMQKGSAYNFSEVGEPTTDAPPIPNSQKASSLSKNCILQKSGELVHLKKISTYHFLMGGPHGAIISEYASYHDNAGLRFTNPKTKL